MILWDISFLKILIWMNIRLYHGQSLRLRLELLIGFYVTSFFYVIQFYLIVRGLI